MLYECYGMGVALNNTIMVAVNLIRQKALIMIDKDIVKIN